MGEWRGEMKESFQRSYLVVVPVRARLLTKVRIITRASFPGVTVSGAAKIGGRTLSRLLLLT